MVKSAAARRLDIDDDETDVETILEAAPFAADGLIGQLADFLIGELKDVRERKPWAKMTEAEQRQLIDRAHGQARSIVAGALRGMATYEFPTIDATLEGGSFKDGELKIKVNALFSGANCDILANGGRFVRLTFASVEAFEGEPETKPQPNQPELPVGETVDPETGEVIEDRPVFDRTDAGAQDVAH